MRPEFGKRVVAIKAARQMRFSLRGNALRDKTKYKLTDNEKQYLAKLSRCTFSSRIWDKRFMRNCQGLEEMTMAQRESLHRLVYRYRRQLGMNDKEAGEVLQYLRLQAQIGEVLNSEMVTL